MFRAVFGTTCNHKIESFFILGVILALKVMLSLSKTIAIVGATGGLGQEIARQSISSGYNVIAVVRDAAKAKSLFDTSVAIKSVDLSTGEGLADAFAGADVVVEVISNSERPHGIQTIVSTCEESSVKVFVACGGAGQLFIDPEKSKRLVTILETLPNMGWARPITDLHQAVQEIAFKSSIPTVFQIAPPGMTNEGLTNKFTATKDMNAGVNSASYQDVASVLLETLNDAPSYNRAMMGVSPKP